VRTGQRWVLVTPGNVTATAMSQNAVYLTWSDTNTREHGYMVERSQQPDGGWVEIAVTLEDVEALEDTTLTAGTTYYYRIRAYRQRRRQSVYSWYSDPVAVTTLGGVTTTSSTSTTSSTTLPPTTTTTLPGGGNLPPVAVGGPDQSGSVGQTITLNGSGSYDPDGSITLYYWDPGDGSGLRSTSVLHHVYDTASSYTARLYVRDDEGVWDNDTVTVTVSGVGSTTTTTLASTTSTTLATTTTLPPTTTTVPSTTTTSVTSTTQQTTTTSSTSTTSSTAPNIPPNANAGPNIATQTNSNVTLNGSGSSDPDGNIVSWSWSFGDGGTGSGAVVVHAYATPGTYQAVLTVTDNDGAQDSDAATVTVTNRAPVADAGPDQVAAVGGQVSFDGSGSMDPDGQITSWSWNFGDGASGSGVAPVHAYGTAGTYVTTLTVTDDHDDHGSQDSDSLTVTVSAGQTDEWAESFGSSMPDGSAGVAVDLVGNVTSVGFFRDVATIGGQQLTSAGLADAYVAHFGPTGTFQWIRQLGGTSGDFAESVAVDGQGNVIVVGQFTGSATIQGSGTPLESAGGSDMFVAKYSASGALLWVRTYGGVLSDVAKAVATDSTGSIYVSGFFSDSIDFGGGVLEVPFSSDLDVFLLKLSPSGTHVWSKGFWNLGNEIGFGLATGPDNSVVMTGTFNAHVDFGGGVLQVAGFEDDVFLAKFTTAGTHLWSRRAGATGDDAGRAVTVDDAGRVSLVGTFLGSVSFGGATLTSSPNRRDAFVAQYSSTGSHRWSRALGGPDHDQGIAVAADGQGRVVVMGTYKESIVLDGASIPSSGLDDIFVARYSQSGVLGWSETWGGAGSDAASGLATGSDDSVVSGGSFRNTAVIGPETLTSTGMSDAFVTCQSP
jgi:PKD repeat protein